MKSNMLKYFLLLCVTYFTTNLSAEDIEINGIYYNITSASKLTAEVTYKGNNPAEYLDEYEGDISIPDEIEYNDHRLKVTKIGNHAFMYCTNIQRIELPKNLSEIGTCAFNGCEELYSIKIPSAVEHIGASAFTNTALTHIEIPVNVKSIKSDAFSYCKSLSSVYFANQSTDIGEACFMECTKLAHVQLPDKMGSIPSDMFKNCSSLNNISLPSTIKSIGTYAFYGCSNLHSIILPENLSYIGYYSFNACPKLEEIMVFCQTPPQIQSNTFSEMHFIAVKLNVPEESLSQYQNSEFWGSFWNIKGFSPSSINTPSNQNSKQNNIFSTNGYPIKSDKTTENALQELPNGIYIINGRKYIKH